MDKDSSVFKTIEKVKTPLSVTGLALLILYLIIKAVLGLDIYDKIGSENTFKVMDKVITYVFIVAIIALVLGVASYIIVRVQKKKLNPK